jgi:Mor family transcriptional regulator
MNAGTEKWGKFTPRMEVLVTDITQGFIEDFGDTPDVARKRAESAMGRFQFIHGGSTFFVPRGCQDLINAKYRLIYRRFTGANQRELAQEFALTVRNINRSIAIVRKNSRV